MLLGLCCPLLLAAAPSINLGNIKNSEKFFGIPGIEPWATGCKARTKSIVLCGPPNTLKFTRKVL